MRSLLFLFVVLPWTLSQAGEVLVAHAGHERGRYQVEVDVRLAADKAQVWRLLTDYVHYGQLNEAIRSSEILERRGKHALRVRTVTEACVYVFCRNIVQVQDVTQANENYVSATVLPHASHFRHGVARMRLWEEGAMTRVRITAEVEPDFWIPPLIGPWLIKRKLRAEALETVHNVERLCELQSS